MSNFQLPPGMRPAAPPSQQGGGAGGAPGPSDEEREARRAQQDEMKRTMIQAMLEPAARERPLTRPQLAAQVEDLLVRMGQQGQIRGQVTDDALKGLLEQVSNPPQPKPTAPVVSGGRTRTLAGGITRKRDDSDDEEYDL